MALRITIIYLLTGWIWIAGSDWALATLVDYFAIPHSTYLWISSWKGFFYVGVTGVVLFLHLQRSITKLVASEQRYFQSNQNLEALINNTSDLIWSVNQNFQLISINKAFQDNISSIIGRPIAPGDSVLYKEFGPEELTKWQAFYEKTLRGEELLIEERVHLLTTPTAVTEISINPIKDQNGKIVGIGCFARNITELRNHLDRIEKQNEKLQEIAWIQSHKLRAPVANILGLVNIFDQKVPDNPVNKEVMEFLKISSKQLDVVIHEIVQKANEFNRTEGTNKIKS